MIIPVISNSDQLRCTKLCLSTSFNGFNGLNRGLSGNSISESNAMATRILHGIL